MYNSEHMLAINLAHKRVRVTVLTSLLISIVINHLNHYLLS